MEFLVIQTVEIYGKEVFLLAVSTPCFDDVSISMSVSFIFTYHSLYIHSSHQHPGHALDQAATGLHLPHLAEGGYRQRAKRSAVWQDQEYPRVPTLLTRVPCVSVQSSAQPSERADTSLVR